MNPPPPRLRLVEPPDPAPPQGDESLMLRVMHSDQRAFATLVERHELSVRRFCQSILENEARAQDAAQETFLKLWSHRKSYRAKGRFLGFLFTIARNTARSSQRKHQLRRWVGLSSAPERSAPEPMTGALIQAQTLGLVHSALEGLPERFRTPLVLRFIENLSYEEIAEVIGRTPSTARSRVHYGLKALRARLPEEVSE